MWLASHLLFASKGPRSGLRFLLAAEGRSPGVLLPRAESCWPSRFPLWEGEAKRLRPPGKQAGALCGGAAQPCEEADAAPPQAGSSSATARAARVSGNLSTLRTGKTGPCVTGAWSPVRESHSPARTVRGPRLYNLGPSHVTGALTTPVGVESTVKTVEDPAGGGLKKGRPGRPGEKGGEGVGREGPGTEAGCSRGGNAPHQSRAWQTQPAMVKASPGPLHWGCRVTYRMLCSTGVSSKQQ